MKKLSLSVAILILYTLTDFAIQPMPRIKNPAEKRRDKADHIFFST